MMNISRKYPVSTQSISKPVPRGCMKSKKFRFQMCPMVTAVRSLCSELILILGSLFHAFGTIVDVVCVRIAAGVAVQYLQV